MANVFDIADFIIETVNASPDDQITNLKLNKLLYYAQGIFLSRTGNPLFTNKIAAWVLGPVVPDVYYKYRVCGKNPIPSSEEKLNIDGFSDDEIEALLDTMEYFGQYTGSRLVDMTHEPGSPWDITEKSGKTVIPLSEIKSYFDKHSVKRWSPSPEIAVVKSLPNDWYEKRDDDIWEEAK